jgi:hypothetical protein
VARVCGTCWRDSFLFFLHVTLILFGFSFLFLIMASPKTRGACMWDMLAWLVFLHVTLILFVFFFYSFLCFIFFLCVCLFCVLLCNLFFFLFFSFHRRHAARECCHVCVGFFTGLNVTLLLFGSFSFHLFSVCQCCWFFFLRVILQLVFVLFFSCVSCPLL